MVIARCATSDMCLQWNTECDVDKDCIDVDCCFSDFCNAPTRETSPRNNIGDVINCYDCLFEGSSCTENNLACSAPFDRCLKGAIKADGKTRVIATCATSDLCSKAKADCNANKDCEAADCCLSDLCNASPGKTSRRNTGNRINCYNCEGEGSGCRENKITCSAQFDRCFKGVIKVDGQTRVLTSCATSDLCWKAKAACKANKDCVAANCCFSNLCNGSPGTTFFGNTGYTINCYNCEGEGSSCKENNVRCLAKYDRCFKSIIKVDGKTRVFASCANNEVCSQAKAACKANKDCEAADCCFSNLCNGSPGTTFPGNGRDAINCYDCQGLGSSCKENNKRCSAKYDRCFKGIIKIDGKTRVFASCANSEMCSQAKTACKNNKDCLGAGCCFKDLCNGSPGVLTVTVGALVISLVAAIL